ncbi:13597_t:CDS:2 [Ambispora leptoticha]|uniref:13597_t:CDS:1 n=1 Tax=Ambispora leptoticha TaxID=144679 RepID=A0A9N8VL82_9GLOM|nr:13597_t:CDS:2 [Ambispora leptoticha]
MSSTPLHPEVLWAQRTDVIYVTINLSDVNEPELEVTKDKISFKGKGGAEQKLYAFELNLYQEINPEASKQSQTGRSIFLVLDKAEHGQSYWPRLTKEKVKLPYLKTDFSKWKDEDEEEGGDQDALELPELETTSDSTKINTEPVAVEKQEAKEPEGAEKTEKAEEAEKTENEVQNEK